MVFPLFSYDVDNCKILFFVVVVVSNSNVRTKIIESVRRATSHLCDA